MKPTIHSVLFEQTNLIFFTAPFFFSVFSHFPLIDYGIYE